MLLAAPAPPRLSLAVSAGAPLHSRRRCPAKALPLHAQLAAGHRTPAPVRATQSRSSWLAWPACAQGRYVHKGKEAAQLGPIAAAAVFTGCEPARTAASARLSSEAAHRLTWPCARNSAMSALQVGQGLTTLRTRIVRRPAAPSASASSRPCPNPGHIFNLPNIQ